MAFAVDYMSIKNIYLTKKKIASQPNQSKSKHKTPYLREPVEWTTPKTLKTPTDIHMLDMYRMYNEVYMTTEVFQKALSFFFKTPKPRNMI